MSTLLPLAGIADLDLSNVSLRWIHLIAGVTWIGMLWFFNWVNGAFTATMDAETKQKVVPELMPRALWWFRWGAAFTWLSGAALLFLLYYHGGRGFLIQGGGDPTPMQWLSGFLGLFVGWVVYDLLMKTLGNKSELAAMVVWGALAVGFACVLRGEMNYSLRAVYIHVGALFGTSMAANVWMRIWPAQQRIIGAIKNGQAPPDGDAPLAGMRSRQNTYMSVPLLLFMVSVHETSLHDADCYHTIAAVIIAVGWLATWRLYKIAPTIKGF